MTFHLPNKQPWEKEGWVISARGRVQGGHGVLARQLKLEEYSLCVF